MKTNTTNTLNLKFHEAFENCIKALEERFPQTPIKDIIPWPRCHIPLSLIDEFQAKRYMREYLDSLSI